MHRERENEKNRLDETPTTGIEKEMFVFYCNKGEVGMVIYEEIEIDNGKEKWWTFWLNVVLSVIVCFLNQLINPDSLIFEVEIHYF